MTTYNSRESNHDYDQKPLSNILPVFASSLIDNFTLSDVKPNLELNFSKTEIESICNEKEGERQTFNLLSVLERKSESVNDRFVESLEYDYRFIKSAIMAELSLPSERTLNFLKKKRELLNIDQKFIDYNVRRLTEFCQLRRALLKLSSSSMMRNIVIRGNLGAGKKWLALDVLTEYTVLKALNFKVYWLDVKICTSAENTLVKLQELRHLVDPNYRFSSLNELEKTIGHQQTTLARLFEDKNDCESLVVLVDVQNKNALQAFIKLGCKLLILTRYERVSGYLSNKTTKCIELDDKMTPNEIENLFALYSQTQCKEYRRSRIEAIYKKTQNPLKLSFIASVLPVADWHHWEKNNFNKLTQIVESSLNVLNEDNQRYFAALLIFPEDAEIPIDILTSLWDVKSEDSEDILAIFKKNSLVKRNADEGTITLSNIYSDQLSKSKKITDMINKSDLHEKVVHAFNIDAAFDQRDDPELANLPKYFFSHIIHHLPELKERERDMLFKKILLDFGFLEKKIRSESCTILNTLQQLNFYKKQDYCSEEQRKLIHEICQFLPKVEEKLMLSNDTCLLQYALMENGALHMEAKRQMLWYPKQVWLTETGSFHQRRQLVQLGKQPLKAIYLDSEECLVVLNNHEIMLVNLSLEHDPGNTQLQNNQEIRQWLVFNRQQELLTLNKHGQVNLFSLNANRSTSGAHLMQRQSSKKKVPNFKPISQKAAHGSKPRSPKWTFKYNNKKRIVALNITEQVGKIDLYAACDTGDVHPFEWIQQNGDTIFRPTSSLPIATKLKDESEIRFISKLLNQYILLLSNNGTISIWRIRDTSEVFKKTIAKAGKVVHMTTYDIQEHATIALFVFSHKVFAMHYPKNNTIIDFNKLDLKLFYEQPSNEEGIVPINCAKLSYDNCYLLLGTEKGLTVVDVATQLSVLCSNISEKITCVDISCLDTIAPNDPKYIVLCGAIGNTFLHVYAIRTAVDDKQITWLHHVECMSNKAMPKNIALLEPDVRWRGEKLYDVTYGENGGINLLAVDSKNRIHQVIKNDNDWTIIPQESVVVITAVTTLEERAFVGYKNGCIFNANKEHYLQQDFLKTAIDYLHLLDDNTLIASSYESSRTLIVRKLDASILNEDDYIKLDFYTRQAYKLYEHYLILIASDSVRFIDLNHKQIFAINDEDIFLAWDYQQTVLFLATNNNKILIYRFTNSDDQLKFMPSPYPTNERPEESGGIISCLAAAPDGSLIALGYNNGTIELYKHHGKEITYIYPLKSHTHKIMEMRFSPEKDVLVSCAEQICFWNVNYMLNNESSISSTTKRRSSRFSVQRSLEDKGTEEVDAMPVNSFTRHLPVDKECNDNLRYAMLNTCKADRSQWHQKQGHASKPELFACIKFDGNEAVKFFANKHFTQFDMIDNEGVYYQLRLLDPSTDDDADDDVFYSFERSLHSDVNIERDIGNGIVMAHEHEHADEDDGGVDVVYDSIISNNLNKTTAHDIQDDGQEVEGATALPLAV